MEKIIHKENLQRKEILDNMLNTYLTMKPFKNHKKDKEFTINWYKNEYEKIGFDYEKQQWFLYYLEIPKQKCNAYANII